MSLGSCLAPPPAQPPHGLMERPAPRCQFPLSVVSAFSSCTRKYQFKPKPLPFRVQVSLVLTLRNMKPVEGQRGVLDLGTGLGRGGPTLASESSDALS